MQRFFEGKKWLLLIAIVLAGSHARAQGTRDTLILNLDKALEIALSDNPTIKVAEEEIALKKVSRKETWQNLLPEASITGSMSHTITAVENSRASKLDLVNQVTKAYYQLMLSQDSYEVLQKSYELAEENYNIVNAKYQQGAVSEFDKITAEVQMRSVKPSVISAGNAVTLSKLQLKVLMGVTADVEIKIDDSLAAYESIVFANQLENDAHEGLVNNTTIKQLELNRLMLQKNIKSLRTNFMPTIGLGYSYQYQSMNNDSWNIFDYHYSGSSSLVFNLSIPLYKASNFTKLKSNRIQMRQLDQNRIDTERKLNMQITSYQDNMAASSEQVSSNKENVMQAEKAVQIAGKRYEVGKGTVLELNTSQVQLTEAELTYNQSIYDYLVAKADLDQVLGRDYIISNQK